MILQSPPVWWSGLKAEEELPDIVQRWSPPVWWSGLKDPRPLNQFSGFFSSPPVWWSGLKGNFIEYCNISVRSPPVWWSGLKVFQASLPADRNQSPPVWWSGLKVNFSPIDLFFMMRLHLCGGVD